MSNEHYVAGLEEYSSDEALANVKLFHNYPEALLQFASVCCVLFMVVGIPGNIITIIALARYKKLRNATAFFIMNLSVSDLLLCCFNLPLVASTLWRHSWPHGKLLCRMFPVARYALVAVSIFTVLFITINRYVMIAHPRFYPKVYTEQNIIIMIISIWILCFSLLLPTWFEVWGRFSLNTVVGSCTIIPDLNNTSPKKFMFISAFLLPALTIIICYARILWIVKKSTKKSRGPIRTKSEPENIMMDSNAISRCSIPENENNRVTNPTKSPLALNCLMAPELSSSFESQPSPEEPEKKCTFEVKPRTLSVKAAKRFRQSFIATIRKSNVTIPTPRMPTKKDKKLRTMIAAVMIPFFVCHLPITLAKTIFQDFTLRPEANIISYLLIYITTCINPLIYVVMSIEYRQAYKSLFICR